uniref:Uncharacterized protein n=1 Tax=Anguilla anguilla TaxID=7936 RepID=A0A0E9XPK0_ANGAN
MDPVAPCLPEQNQKKGYGKCLVCDILMLMDLVEDKKKQVRTETSVVFGQEGPEQEKPNETKQTKKWQKKKKVTLKQ